MVIDLGLVIFCIIGGIFVFIFDYIFTKEMKENISEINQSNENGDNNISLWYGYTRYKSYDIINNTK